MARLLLPGCVCMLVIDCPPPRGRLSLCGMLCDISTRARFQVHCVGGNEYPRGLIVRCNNCIGHQERILRSFVPGVVPSYNISFTFNTDPIGPCLPQVLSVLMALSLTESMFSCTLEAKASYEEIQGCSSGVEVKVFNIGLGGSLFKYIQAYRASEVQNNSSIVKYKW